MSENSLQKKGSETIKEKAQYVLAFGVVATMLLVAQFPMFVVIFFGIFTYFLWKTFTQPSITGVREIFEFYISANGILRDEERRWFGFEIQKVIATGERLIHKMNGAPPLIYFTLGALYNKIGNHKAAVTHLSYVLENEVSDEANYLYATPDLISYVRVLREVESEPNKHPLTASAVRALERTRRTRGKAILENSRRALESLGGNLIESDPKKLIEPKTKEKNTLFAPRSIEAKPKPAATSNETEAQPPLIHFLDMSEYPVDTAHPQPKKDDDESEKGKHAYQNRKPISELLKDIYDD